MVQSAGINMNLIIDESYPGLIKSGVEYKIDGNLKSDFNIEVNPEKI
jgi:hypothetical protein